MNPLDLTQTRSMQPAPRRRLWLVRRLAPALLLSLAPLFGAGQPVVVQAASGDCAPSGAQMSCTFTYTGTEQTWQVPPGVSSVQVTAVGGSGSSNVATDGTTVAGGKGAKVTATVQVPAGTTTLYVEVGAPVLTSNFGFNGGAGQPGYQGGDASDVRTCSMASCPFFFAGSNNCTLAFDNCDTRLVVAGGGGGAGACAVATGGSAGDSAVTGAGAGGAGCAPGSSGGFGGPPGGGGGISPSGSSGAPAHPNQSLIGATNDNICVKPIVSTLGLDVTPYITNPVACIKDKISNPGFGGAGYDNGGDGGVPSTPGPDVASGGGGGSSFWVPTATNTSMATDTTGMTSVTISYLSPLTIAANPKTMNYGGALPTFDATYTGLVNGDTSSVVTGLSRGAVDFSAKPVGATTSPGVYTITCSGASAAGYSISYQPSTLTIVVAPLTITANNKSMTYGGSVPTFDASYTGLVNGDTSSVAGAITCTAMPYAQPVSAASPAGTYPISCSPPNPWIGKPTNYTVTFVNGTLTINPAPLTITANNKTMPYGGPLPTFDATYSGLVNGDTPGSPALPTAATCTAKDASGNIVGSLTPAGTYAITCVGADSHDYTFTYLPGTLTVTNPAPSTTGLSSGALQAGSGATTVTISGAGFVPQSRVQLALPGGTITSLSPTTVASSGAQLSVSLPATVLATPGTLQLGVLNAAPGGGTSNPQTLFVTQAATSVSAISTGATSASLGNGAVQATATGSGTLTLAQFSADPTTASPPSAVNAYFDVYAPADSSYSQITVVDCNLGGGQVVYWFNGKTWKHVSSQSYANGCATLTLTPTSAPSLIQLSGTYFGAQSTQGSNCNLASYPIQNGVLNLSGAVLGGCSLAQANLAGANLNQASLVGAYLRGANLSGAGANLGQADMSSAYLVGANLTNANLNKANLTGADLTAANLSGANLNGVTWSGTTCPDGITSDADGGSCIAHLTP